MKIRKTASTVLALLTVLLFTATACADGVFANDGLTLSIPEEYRQLLTVEVPENDESGFLFRVSETASLEAAAPNNDGAGALFSIRRIDEETLREMLCCDMSGMELFAKDQEGSFYLYCHPTDVRLVRANNEELKEASAQWTELNEWAWNTVRDRFIAENKGLSPETCEEAETDPDAAADLLTEPAAFDEWDSSVSPEITDDLQSVCDRAFSMLMGVDYEPTALLAVREDDAKEYCVLCRTTVVYPGAKPGYALVYLSEDAEGQVTINNIYDLWIAEHSEKTD